MDMYVLHCLYACIFVICEVKNIKNMECHRTFEGMEYLHSFVRSKIDKKPLFYLIPSRVPSYLYLRHTFVNNLPSHRFSPRTTSSRNAAGRGAQDIG